MAANGAPSGVPTPTPLLTALVKVGVKDAASWVEVLADGMRPYGIYSKLQRADFLANVLNETGLLTTFTENLNYSTAALVAQWPSHFTVATADAFGRNAAHPANQPMIAELAYGGRMGNRAAGYGDGWAYIGRGGIQITGADLYRAASRELSVPMDSLAAFLTSPSGAVRSAAWCWSKAGCAAFADKGDIRSSRSILNVGHVVPAGEDAKIIGLARVTQLYTALMGAL